MGVGEEGTVAIVRLGSQAIAQGCAPAAGLALYPLHASACYCLGRRVEQSERARHGGGDRNQLFTKTKGTWVSWQGLEGGTEVAPVRRH